MVLGIWARTGTIPADPVRLSATATATQADDIISVVDAGATSSYSTADGYRLVEDRRGKRIERFERIDAPSGSTVAEKTVPGFTRDGSAEDRPAYVFRSPSGDSAPSFVADGWQIDDTGTSLERPWQVSRFLNRNNLVLLLTSASFFAIMAVGMTLIIIMGGIDLSIGSIYALAAVSTALLLRSMQPAGQAGPAALLCVPAGFLFCMFIGGVCGLLNGVAIVGLRVHPFIITLGGMAVYRGIAFVLSSGESIGGFPESFRQFVRFEWAGVNPVPACFMIIFGVIGAFIASCTTFGRRTFAIGGNETAARYAGIPVGAVKIALFTIGGISAGLAAAIGLGYFGSATSDSARGYELNVIAAAVVGGASLSGGRGSILGAVLGAIIIQLIDNGFDMLEINTNYKQIVIGLAIVLAVVVDQMKQRLFAR